MTSIHISRARRWGVLLAGFALRRWPPARATRPVAQPSRPSRRRQRSRPRRPRRGSAFDRSLAAPSTATSGGGRYGKATTDDYGGVAASPAASADSGGSADAAVVKVASGSIGTFLTGANGMTLYVFKKDSPDKSACSGDLRRELAALRRRCRRERRPPVTA